jgi:transposase InsO family protein
LSEINLLAFHRLAASKYARLGLDFGTWQFYKWEKLAREGALDWIARPETGAQGKHRGRPIGERTSCARSGDRTERRERGAKKGALATAPYRRYSAEEKRLILETVRRTQHRTSQSVDEILRQLTLPSATCYRWKGRQQEGGLADQADRPEALDRLLDRREGEPKLVHDHGSRFLSTEWRVFVEGAGLTDIKTRIAHPESNGRLEQIHRMHRQEGLTEEALEAYHQALEAMTSWSDYYNYRRPHTALKYLCPADYYRGDPQARLAEREQKLA